MRTMSTPIGVADATAIARDGYVFGYPLVLMDRKRLGAPVNRFAHARELPGACGAATSPATGLLRSAAWLDLGPQPVVLTVPDTYGRCCALALVDGWGDVFASVGSRTTGSRHGEYAICGPAFGGAVPGAATTIRAPTRIVRLVGGIQVDRATSYEEAHAVQAGFGLRPLGIAPAASRPAPRSPSDAVDAMAPAEFFGRLAALMHDNPPRLQDRVVVERMRSLGLLADDGCRPELRAAVARGVRQGRDDVLAAAAAPPGEWAGGWWMPAARGRSNLGRAAAARAGFEPCALEDTLPALAGTDAQGRELSGRHRYRLRFAGGSPAVHGFWTLATYAARQALLDDSAEPYAVRDWNGLALDGDGALTIEVGHAPRGGGTPANRLPAPPGRFALMLRLHWPASVVFERGWAPPPVQRID
jgi:hypothetical protein